MHAVLELEDVARADPRETIRRGSRLVSPRVGIVRHVGHGRYHAQDPATFAMGIVASDISRFVETTNTSKGGGGGEDLASALAATLGEAVERYCMFFYDKQTMVRAPYREVARDAVAVDDLRLYSREQVDGLGPQAKMKYLTEDTVIRWVWGYSLTEQRSRLVPASLVYMNYQFSPDEDVIGRNASTGLAASLTLEEAILTGLYEVVERDAFTICWLCQRPGRRIHVDDPALDAFLKRRFHSDHASVKIRIHDITLDTGVASFFLVMQRPAEFGPALCVGSASRLQPTQAVRKCLLEAGQAIPYYRFLLRQFGPWVPADDHSDITSFDHHCVFYLKRPEAVPSALQFLDDVEEDVPLSTLPDRSTGRVRGDVLRTVELLRAAGLEVIVVDITTPDVVEVGMRVVRVIVPGMVPLHGVYRYPFLGSRRLADFPPRDVTSRLPNRAFDTFNRHPHPFP